MPKRPDLTIKAGIPPLETITHPHKNEPIQIPDKEETGPRQITEELQNHLENGDTEKATNQNYQTNHPY